jgi:hypothetical protein
MDNIVPTLLEKHSSERIPPTERKSRPTKRYVVSYKNTRKKTVFSCPDFQIVRPVCVFRASRLFR